MNYVFHQQISESEVTCTPFQPFLRNILPVLTTTAVLLLFRFFSTLSVSKVKTLETINSEQKFFGVDSLEIFRKEILLQVFK